MNYSKGAEWRRWDLHLHTKSSYDYGYNGDDADDLLIKALRDNDIKAVAVTDHFVIDAKRISTLRNLAPEIVFFPGVELRTDKGANNLHVILIFSDQIDLFDLENRFNVIMRGQKAKSSDNDERIYWDFNDIIDFAHNEDALISIHAGRKTSGVDKEIKTESYPYKDAVKDEIATVVNFFDMGQKRDFESYQKFVFPEIGERPMIICSDNHDPRNYCPTESLWIKADCTFEGLKQCIFQPSDRVFVGVIPPSLDRVNKNKRNTIANVSVNRVAEAKHTNLKWFDTSINFNSNLVALIGNKGSGKSAISDIIGQLCKCHTMDQASFLSDRRFRNPKMKYADDYEASITWMDGHFESRNLGEIDADSVLESAQYLPQAYIEKVCNDIGDEFQKEINRVIFSYVDSVERGTARNLNELVENKTKDKKAQQVQLLNKLQTINSNVIKLEDKMTSEYRKTIENGQTKLLDDLTRHDANKPIEVAKPDNKSENLEYQNELKRLNDKIESLEQKKNVCLEQIASLNELIDDTNYVVSELTTLDNSVGEMRLSLHAFLEKHSIQKLSEEINYSSPKQSYNTFLVEQKELRKRLYEVIQGTDTQEGIDAQIDKLKETRNKHIENGDANEKRYQKYLLDLKEWEIQRNKILGDETTPETLTYYNHEKAYLDSELVEDYTKATEERTRIVGDLYHLIEELVSAYNDIYEPIQQEIQNILSGIEEQISFEAEIQLTEDTFVDKTLSYIVQRYAGIFKGKVESREK